MSNGGPVLGIAELLTPVSATLKCLQPFKFIMIDDDNYQRLNRLILLSVAVAKRAQHAVTSGQNLKSPGCNS